MGGALSRLFNRNPRTFYVWNVDSDGQSCRPGKIVVTDSQLTLYQKENVVVVWPLTSLRRYGFDSQVFSFECGRRCTTGAGIYAFKCRRAGKLFKILQEIINNNSGGGEQNAGDTGSANAGPTAEHLNSLVRPLLGEGERLNSIHSSSSLPNGIGSSSPTVDAFGYLEPVTANQYVNPEPSSTTVGPQRNQGGGGGTASPGGYVCIRGSGHVGLEADWSTALGSASGDPRCCSFGGPCGRSNSASQPHYVNNEVAELQQQQQQATACLNGMCIVNQYVNTSMSCTSDLHRCCSPQTCQDENTYVNSMVALSPGHLPCCAQCVDFNTNYAKLDDLLKQEQQQSAKKHKEQQHFYVNVKPDRQHSGSSGSSKCVSGRSSPTDAQLKSPQHCYANLGGSSSPTHSEAKEQAQVNYAVLDLDQSDSNTAVTSPVSASASPASSPVKSPEGYAQIDFDKTVALSNSANPCAAFNDDSMRKTRHNAVIPCSMTA